MILDPRPRIGLTPDESMPPGEHALARYELKRAYADAVLRAGGLPLVLPYSDDDGVLEAYLGLVDGLLITGGAFDVPPELYGEAPGDGLGELKRSRTHFELALTQAALERDLPLLGICGGMQLLNVARQGSLYQDLRTERPGAAAHEQAGDKRLPSHEVVVHAGTRLAAAVGEGTIMVNSTHHQAVKRLGRGLVASGTAGDGVVEAIEDPQKRFALGVQWHPELLAKSVPIHRGIYRAFVTAAAAGSPAPAR